MAHLFISSPRSTGDSVSWVLRYECDDRHIGREYREWHDQYQVQDEVWQHSFLRWWWETQEQSQKRPHNQQVSKTFCSLYFRVRVMRIVKNTTKERFSVNIRATRGFLRFFLRQISYFLTTILTKLYRENCNVFKNCYDVMMPALNQIRGILFF